MKKTLRYSVVNSMLLTVLCFIIFSQAALAKWEGVEPWQNLKMGSPDTFLHFIVGNGIGALIQTKFPDDDRRTQYNKAMILSLALACVKEIADVSQQYNKNKPLSLPDSIKDIAMTLMGTFVSFNFDFGPQKKAKTPYKVFLDSTPESVSLPTDSLLSHYRYSLTY